MKGLSIVITLFTYSLINAQLVSQSANFETISTIHETPTNEKYLWQNEPFGTYPQSAEDVEKRTENIKHFKNSDGSYTAHVSSGKIHYLENGKWKTIYHSIVPTSVGFQNTTNSFKTFYPTTSSGKITTILPSGVSLEDMKDMRMYYEVNGIEVQSKPIQSKQGRVNFNELTYSNVYGTGIDLRLTQHTTKRKMDYIIQNLNALGIIPSGAQFLVFEEKVILPSGWTAQLRNNEILLKDASGNVQAKYEKPIYNDTPIVLHTENGGHSHIRSEIEGEYVIKVVGNTLTIKTKVPMSWLADSNRSFPVTIDPTIDLTMPNTALWTGSVRTQNYLGAWQQTYNDIITLGRTGTGSNFDAWSGWAKFNVAGLNTACMNITSAVLYYNAFNNATTESTCSVFGHLRSMMGTDPVTATDANRLSAIRNGTSYFAHDFKITSLGWKNVGINGGLADLISSIPIGWFAVGFHINSGRVEHLDCFIEARGRSHANKPYLRVDYLDATSTPPTSITGGGTYCWGNDITLNSTGGTNVANVAHVWYKGGCNNAFTQTWNNQPYSTHQTTVNSNNNGILDVTSTGGDPMINMFSLGSFDPATYRYINIRYRVTAGTAGNVEIFFINSTYTSPNAACHTSSPLISDNQWHIATVDLYQNPNYTTGGNITGWRYDWATNTGVRMEIDFIQLSQFPMIDENNATTQLEWTPSHPHYPTAGTTTYAAAKIDQCGSVTSCASTTVTLPNKTNMLSTNLEAATCVVNANETVHFYNTSSGRYIASVSANATGLGSTTVTTHIDNVSSAPNADPILTNACDDPTFQTVVLGRHWVITPSTNTSATVRLPYYNPELTAMYGPSSTSSSPYDNISSQAQLGLSKYSGPNNVDHLWTNNCIPTGGNANTTWQGPNNYGNVADYIAGFPTDRKYSMFNITGFSEFWLHASNVVSPLAVTLSDFNATCEENRTKITWTTASEQNSDYFVLERSRDGLSWEDVSQVDGAGTTNTANVYTVSDVLTKGYYRLKQVDFNGATEYFGPIYAGCDNNRNDLTVYPNPNSGTFNVVIKSTENLGQSVLEIIDLNGKVIESRLVNITNGVNTIYIEDSELKRGTYFISVKTEEERFKPVKLTIY